MRTLLTSAAVLLLVSATLNAQVQPGRTAPAPRVGGAAPVAAPIPPHAPATPRPAPPAATRPIATHPVLPVGWGLVQGPVSTVNHPGGIGRRGPVNPYSQTYIVPLAYPIAVYPQQSDNGGDSRGDQSNANGNYGDTQPQQASYNYPAQYNDQQPASNPAADVAYTLIAFKDHSIYAVVDYWMENNRLNYVTNYGATSSVALDKIDMALTEQLNGDRNMKFELHEKQPGN